MALEFEQIVDSQKMKFSVGTRRLVEGVQRTYVPVEYVPDHVMARIYAGTISGEEFRPSEKPFVGVVRDSDVKAVREYWTRDRFRWW